MEGPPMGSVVAPYRADHRLEFDLIVSFYPRKKGRSRPSLSAEVDH